MFFSWLGPSGWTSICKTVFMFARIAVFVSHFQVIATEALWGGHESHPSNLQNMMNACIFDTSSLLQPVYIYIYTYTSCKTKQTSDDPLYLRSCSRVANASARFSPGTSLSWGSSIGWRSVFRQETSLLTLWPSHIAMKHLSLNGMLLG